MNGIYQGSGEAYVPLNKMPALSNVFLGISCLGGAIMGGWLIHVIPANEELGVTLPLLWGSSG